MKTREILIDPNFPLTSNPRIDAVMLFPNDIASQDQYTSLLLDVCARQRNNDEYTPSQLMLSIWAFKSAAWSSGQNAGQVFLFFLRMLLHHSEKRASIAKAQFLLTRVLGHRHPRTIKDHWSQFRTCSHLHAAYFMAQHVYKKDFLHDTTDTWEWIIRAAHHMLRTAVGLDSAKLGDGWWTISDFRGLGCPSDFEVPPLSERQLNLLSRYRAPTSAK